MATAVDASVVSCREHTHASATTMRKTTGKTTMIGAEDLSDLGTSGEGSRDDGAGVGGGKLSHGVVVAVVGDDGACERNATPPLECDTNAIRARDGHAHVVGDESDGADEELARMRARASSRFQRGTSREAMRAELYQMGQRELQAMFYDMFERATTSNNNQWLRRRIATGLGLEDAASAANERGVANVGGKADGASEPRASSRRQVPRRLSAADGLHTVPIKSEHVALEDSADFTPDGIRKSRRAVKPKAMFDSDAFPSAAKQSEERRREKKRLEAAEQAASTSGRESPNGKAAVGRRVRVYWPFEQQFFAGVVAAYNGRTNKYLINYDDGDQEEIVLSVYGTEHQYQHQHASHERDGGEDERDDERGAAALDAAPEGPLPVMPQPGKSADVLKTLPSSWPNAGALVWGRVKGHGWWPGTVHAKCSGSQGVQEVSFFDNSFARVHRHDLLPFREYYPVLRDAKKTSGYAEAVSRATESYESRAQRSAKRRSKKEDATRAVGGEQDGDDEPRIWHFEKEDATKKSYHKRMKELDAQQGGGAPKRQRASAVEDVPMFDAPAPPRQLSDLAKSLEDMKSKVVPLAKASQKLFVKHLDDSNNGDDDVCLISADERVVMLDELASIESLIAWSEGKTEPKTTFTASTTATELDFMNPLASIGGWKDRPRSNELSPVESALLRQPSQDLLNGDLAGIQWNMDAMNAIADPMGLDPLGTGLGGDVSAQTAPSTPEQHGLDCDSPFTMNAKNVADSCATLHGTYVKGEVDELLPTAATQAS